jgi:hypothetical protein
MTIEQLNACDAISSHFGITKAVNRTKAKEYIKNVGQGPLLELAIDEHNIFFGSSKSTVQLGQAILFKTFEKTDLYADALNLIENYEVEFMVFNIKKTVMVMYKASVYDGIGGLFVRNSAQSTDGWAIEPIKHYLKHKYPVQEKE